MVDWEDIQHTCDAPFFFIETENTFDWLHKSRILPCQYVFLLHTVGLQTSHLNIPSEDTALAWCWASVGLYQLTFYYYRLYDICLLIQILVFEQHKTMNITNVTAFTTSWAYTHCPSDNNVVDGNNGLILWIVQILPQVWLGNSLQEPVLTMLQSRLTPE